MGLFKYLVFIVVVVALCLGIFVWCRRNRQFEQSNQTPAVTTYETKVQSYGGGTAPVYPPPATVETQQEVQMATVVSDIPEAKPVHPSNVEGDIPYYP